MDMLTLDDAASVAPARKALPYKLMGAHAAVTGGGNVSRGESVKSGDPYLIHEDGRTQQAIRLQAVAGAIAGGVIRTDEIARLWAKDSSTLIAGAEVVLTLLADVDPDSLAVLIAEHQAGE